MPASGKTVSADRPIDPENLVWCLSIHRWAAPLDVRAVKTLFDEFLSMIGRPPDKAWVCEGGTWHGKDYSFAHFEKRGVVTNKYWKSLSYAWLRQKPARLYEAISFKYHDDLTQNIGFFLDEGFVGNVPAVFEAILARACDVLKPRYGYGMVVPYSWSPDIFVSGNGSGYVRPIRGLDHDSPEAFSIRGQKAGRLFLSDLHSLDRQLLDIFAVNLLTKLHFKNEIEGKTLKDWIRLRKVGTLVQLNPSTWRWDVPRALVPLARTRAIEAGLIADPFWTDLDWNDSAERLQ
jgi:hypothetical protein